MKEIFKLTSYQTKIICFFLIALYLILLFFNSNSLYLQVADEATYSSSVNSLLSGKVDNNNHPLFGKTILYLVVSAFYILTGTDQTFYWRLPIIILGIGCLIIFYKISRLFFNSSISLVSTTFLALDPMFFVFSRITMLDVPALFFLLLFLLFYLRSIKENNINYLYISAAFLGLSLATKLFALPLVIIIPIMLLLIKKGHFKNLAESLVSILKFEFLISAFYILGNFIYFFMHTSKNFFAYTISQLEAEKTVAHLLANYSDSTSSTTSWFTVPQILTLYRNLSEGSVATIGAFQNPIMFAMTILVLAFTFFAFINNRKGYDSLLLQIFIIFFALFLPWLAPIRPTYYYYVIPLIPLVILLAVSAFLQFKEYAKFILLSLLFIQLLTFAIFYPILVGISIPYKYEKFLMSYSLYKYPDRNSLTCQLCSPLKYPTKLKNN